MSGFLVCLVVGIFIATAEICIKFSRKETQFDQAKLLLVDFICFLLLHAESDCGFFYILSNNSYLYEEWKERHSNVVDDVSKFLHLRFISLEVFSFHMNI